MEPGRRWEPWGDYVGLHALLRRLLEERRAAAEAEPDGGTAEGTGGGGGGGAPSVCGTDMGCVALLWGGTISVALLWGVTITVSPSVCVCHC